jgi:molybdopterin-binding protein
MERQPMSISARNPLKGKISQIIVGDVMAEVTIGDNVIAVIKATEVMVSKGN